MTCGCPQFCSGCGRNIRPDNIVERDGFKIDPLGSIEYNGRVVHGLTAAMASVLHSLAQENGRTVTRSTLLSRYTSVESLDTAVTRLVSEMRWMLEGQGIPNPIGTRHARMAPDRSGYYWRLPE